MQTADTLINSYHDVLRDCRTETQLDRQLKEVSTKWRGKQNDFRKAAENYKNYWKTLSPKIGGA